MAPDDDDAARPVEHLFGRTGEEWGGVIAGVLTGIGLLWITADFPLYLRAGAVLVGLVAGLAVGVSAVRALSDRPRVR